MIRDITDLYNRNIISIVLLGLSIVIPVTFFLYCAISYFNMIDTVELNNLMTLFLMLVNFTVLFPPFLYIVKYDLSDTPIKMKDLIKIFFYKFGLTSSLTLLFFLIAIIGTYFFYIPTIIAIMMMILIPIFSDEERFRTSIKEAWNIVKSEHIFILLDLAIIFCLNLLVWAGSLYFLAGFENGSILYMTIRVVINSVFFPLFYFYLTMKYRRDLGEEYGA